MLSFFTHQQIIVLLISMFFLLASVLLFSSRRSMSLLFLSVGTFIVGYFIAELDPFLILWDEQFHALVAKHMVVDPFQPMLYNTPILEYDFKNWTSNHIWLHKQPLFLWLMSLSIKFFGTSAIAVRLPSVMMHAIIPLFIYRVGTISINERVGYAGAIFFGIAFFPLELCAGRYSTDHNDVAFLFFMTASIWSWFEYQKSKHIKWLIFIAVFSGCAVLVKWLMGLLIYIIWVMVIFFSGPERWKMNSYMPVVIGFCISTCIFLPWQVYVLLNFPREAQYEFVYNGKHFFEALEGHTGTAFFYFTEGFEQIYGAGFITPFFYLIGFILLIIRVKEKRYKIAFSAAVMFVYLFYSIAKTKMVAFPVIVSPIIFLGLGVLVIFIIDWITSKISDKKIVYSIQCILILATVFFVVDFSKIEQNHTMKYPNDNHQRYLSLNQMKFIRSLKKNISEKNTVLFNTNICPFGDVQVMFHTDFIAYSFIPSKEQIEVVKSKGYKIAVLGRNDLPSYIVKDKTIKILPSSF